MLLKSLSLKNYRKFEDTFVEFPEGVTGIVGLNGAGKSTLFEAIAWVLYGSMGSRTSVDQIRSRGVDSSEVCRVCLEFEFAGQKYSVTRQMRGKGLVVHAVALVDGSVAAEGGSAVSEFVLKTLGMDYRSFFTSIFARQKELNALSSMQPSERRPLILRLLGVDSLDRVVGFIRKDIRLKSEVLARLQEELEGSDGLSRQDALKQDLVKIKQDISSKSKSLSDQKARGEALIAQIGEWEDMVGRKRRGYEGLVKQKELLEEKKKSLELRRLLESEVKTLDAESGKLQEEIEGKKNQLASLKTVAQSLAKEKSALEALDANLAQLSSKRKEIVVRSEQLDAEKRRFESRLKRLSDLGPEADCPTCERRLGTQFETLQKKFSSDLSEVVEKRQGLEQSLIVLKNSEAEEKKKRAEVVRSVGELEKKNAMVQRLDGQLVSLVKSHSELQKKLAKKNSVLSEMGNVRFDEKKYEQFKGEVEKSYESWQQASKKLQTMQKDVTTSGVLVERLRGERKVLEQRASEIKLRSEELKKSAGRLKALGSEVSSLRSLEDVMSDFRVHVVSQIRPALSEYASELFALLTEGKYGFVDLDEQYNLIVDDAGQQFSLERFSGGEVDLANLCVRLAISEVLSERSGSVFNFIVLDEVFGSQDVFRRQNIVDALSSFSGKFRQIFLITHLDEVKNQLENIIEVVESDDGSSRVIVQ